MATGRHHSYDVGVSMRLIDHELNGIELRDTHYIILCYGALAWTWRIGQREGTAMMAGYRD